MGQALNQIRPSRLPGELPIPSRESLGGQSRGATWRELGPEKTILTAHWRKGHEWARVKRVVERLRYQSRQEEMGRSKQSLKYSLLLPAEGGQQEVRTEPTPSLREDVPEMLQEVSWHLWTLDQWGELTRTPEELVAGALQTLREMGLVGFGPSCVTLGK